MKLLPIERQEDLQRARNVARRPNARKRRYTVARRSMRRISRRSVAESAVARVAEIQAKMPWVMEGTDYYLP